MPEQTPEVNQPEFVLNKAEAELLLVAVSRLPVGGTVDQSSDIMNTLQMIGGLRVKLRTLIEELDTISHGNQL